MTAINDDAIDLNGIRFRNRVAASASLVGYGARPATRLLPYGMSPIAQFVGLEHFGAVTTRTVTLTARDGHFTSRTDWSIRDWPDLVRRYSTALRPIDSGWLNAFGWANIGLDAYLVDYFERTHALNRILSLGGFSAHDFVTLASRVSDRVAPGAIAAVEFNLSCHNVNFEFTEILEAVLAEAVPKSRHPVILKLSPDDDYVTHAKLAERYGVAGLTAINTVKGLRLDPRSGEPLLLNGFGGMSGRCIKPIALRVVADIRAAGVELPIIATGGIRDFDDAREFFWAGADVVSFGSAAFLASKAGYLAAPLKAARIRRTANRINAWSKEPAQIPSRLQLA